ncbi:MAG: ASKHA domain-containing protein, partial [Candidatus Desantisbacteria bacterium]
NKGYCLACLCTVESDLVVEVPAESRLELDKISEEEAYDLRLKGMFSKAEEIDRAASLISEDIFVHSPLATKLYLEIPPPTLDDKISDLERLYRQIRKIQDIPIMQTGLSNIKRLGQVIRSSDWNVTVTLGKRNGTTEIVLIEPGDTSNKNYGLAFDIGTTTVSGQLVDLNTKQILGTKASHNRQASFGSDIISRIIFAQEENGLDRLHHAVIDVMNGMIQDLIQEHRVSLNDVNCCLCAGNTTMIHLLLRVDPTYIRRDPYVPTANFVPVIRASEAGIKINPRGLLACVPGVSSYVGGDVVAGVLSCGLDREEELSLLIDIGTNGEVVLGNKEWLISCSASAGPAFEGSGVTCGMRATKGAIQKVKIESKTGKVNFSTIADTPAIGICGSGYIDLLAQFLSAGIIDPQGKFVSLPKSKFIRDSEFGKEFILVPKGQGGLESDIVINEVDIENLKRAKAAIFASTSILIRHMGLEFSSVKKIFIAGGFGNYLDINNAISIGLLPDLPRERFIFVGNSSLAGARQIIDSAQALDKAGEIAKKITYFELSVEPGYMEEYVAALFFPHTNRDRFPSVKI